jgi:hypothetical protein
MAPLSLTSVGPMLRSNNNNNVYAPEHIQYDTVANSLMRAAETVKQITKSVVQDNLFESHSSPVAADYIMLVITFVAQDNSVDSNRLRVAEETVEWVNAYLLQDSSLVSNCLTAPADDAN